MKLTDVQLSLVAEFILSLVFDIFLYFLVWLVLPGKTLWLVLCLELHIMVLGQIFSSSDTFLCIVFLGTECFNFSVHGLLIIHKTSFILTLSIIKLWTFVDENHKEHYQLF